MSNGVKTLKWRLFKRDGWQELNPRTGRKQWYALCSFTCGQRITMSTATIDHYPIPRRLGGRLILENTRLACSSCNNRDGGRHGEGAQFIPKGLTPLEKRLWWQQYGELKDHA